MANDSVVLELNPSNYGSAPAEDNNNDENEKNRVCPLCKSEIRLFFINFNEKLLMCENTECEFPFGHEDLQFMKVDADVASDNEDISMKTKSYWSSTIAESTVSASAWSDIDKLNRAFLSEDIQPETPLRDKTVHKKKKKTDALEMLKTIKDIKDLNKEILEVEKPTESECQIKNTKWIRNLKNLEEISGLQLLKPGEIGLLRKEEPVIGLGELKIDIDPGDIDNMSSIKIEIHNNNIEIGGNVETLATNLSLNESTGICNISEDSLKSTSK